MLIIPAIDILDGRCVRLRQGDPKHSTVYSDDPLAMADRWVQAGARRLHIIDLNGAGSGKPENMAVVRTIAERYPALPVQVGGGIRDEDTIQQYLDAGVSHVILGTRAISTPHFVAAASVEFPGHVIVSLDARDGRLAVEGWSRLSRHKVTEVARTLEDDGTAAIIYTSIDRDGMMSRIDMDATIALCDEVCIPVIAAGGLAGLEDIRALCAAADEGIVGVITGRAIYEGVLDFAEAQQLADELCPPQEDED